MPCIEVDISSFSSNLQLSEKYGKDFSIFPAVLQGFGGYSLDP